MIYRSMFGLPHWNIRSPFDELDHMKRQMDRLMNFWGGSTTSRNAAGVFPPINLTEDRDHYYVRAELPGMTQDSLDIQVAAKTLSIAGERKIENQGGEVRYHRREREGGHFSRVVTLPGEINADKVQADLVDGVLTVKIPKAEAQKPRQVTVRAA
jgi:HSP20 family protein